jgi:hypothetical protein
VLTFPSSDIPSFTAAGLKPVTSLLRTELFRSAKKWMLSTAILISDKQVDARNQKLPESVKKSPAIFLSLRRGVTKVHNDLSLEISGNLYDLNRCIVWETRFSGIETL